MSRKEPMKVDVCMLTLNSVKPVLRKCLESLRREVPVNRLIVVDGGSTDSTLKICFEFFPECKIIMDVNGNRATARQKAIDAVETDWFIFIDSDVVLCNNWFNEILKVFHGNINSQIGAVQGLDIPVYRKESLEFQDAINLLRRKTRWKETRPAIFGMFTRDRGFTGDTLIRTVIVKGMIIPTGLHVFEDRFIKRFIESKGYKWIICDGARCKHYLQPYNKQKLDIIFCNEIAYHLGYLNFRNVFRACLIAVPKGLFASGVKGNIRLLLYILYEQLLTLVGYLRGVIAYRD